MEKLLKSITPGKLISIKGKTLKARAKSVYVAQSQPLISYTKIFMEEHHVLVICSKEKFAYFGKDVGSIGFAPPFQKNITYKGLTYQLISHDYQIVTCLEFGDPLETEGEVEYWDYQSDNYLLSIAVIKRNNKRSDIVAQIISPDDIRVIDNK